MKKLLLLIFFATFSFQSYGQDSDILDTTWHLLNVHITGQDNFPPPYNDFVTGIRLLMTDNGGQGTFETAVCNFLGGMVIYNGSTSFELLGLKQTLGSCDGDYDDQYEHIYFNFYYDNSNSPFTYIINNQGNDALKLTVTGVNGDYAEYGNAALGVTDLHTSTISIFPNPVSEALFISSEETLQSITIYNIAGQMVLSETEIQNQIDVSKLAPALYFAEFTTSEGKSIQNIIKK